MLFVIVFTPLISALAMQFTSFEFFLLAFFGILISGSISTPDTVQKGWIAGFLGLFLAVVGRDGLQFYPRFTLGWPALEGGIEVVPVLIGAFGIPQLIQVLKDKVKTAEAQKLERIRPSWRTVGAQHPQHRAQRPDRRGHRRGARHRRGHRRLGLLRHGQEVLQAPRDVRQGRVPGHRRLARRPTTPASAGPSSR